LGANWDVTAQVSELALLDQNQRLVHSNHELEQFAHVTSHDLQEPLRAVAGCAQLLQKRYRGKLGADADEIVDHLVDGALRMRTLIQDILALSRIQSQREAFRDVPSEQALAAALENLSAAISESAASITYDSLPTVRGDASQLALLFQNLIGNAIKYRSHQPPQIHVSAVASANGVSFAVRDNGIGIEPQYFEHIFGAFQRLHSRSAHPGTGIGLAICKKIVERHAGRIWVESAPGAGSTFCFTLGHAAHGGEPEPAAPR
jgi:light-regulated signal transduction histidine kinase (bacteriophytochrome)